MMDVSKPSREKRMMSPRDEISAVASPTCSTVYSRAAIIQKKKPQPALNRLVAAMNIEFLYSESLASLAIPQRGDLILISKLISPQILQLYPPDYHLRWSWAQITG